MIDLYFADYDTAGAAVLTEQATVVCPSISLAAGGVRILFSEVEQARTS